MSKYILNIGLHNPMTGEENTLDHTLIVVTDFVRDIQNVAVKQSNTERTLIVECNQLWGSMEVLCVALDQDCIAVYDNEAQQGFLFGDRADQWGEFNPEFFLTI